MSRPILWHLLNHVPCAVQQPNVGHEGLPMSGNKQNTSQSNVVLLDCVLSGPYYWFPSQRLHAAMPGLFLRMQLVPLAQPTWERTALTQFTCTCDCRVAAVGGLPVGRLLCQGCINNSVVMRDGLCTTVQRRRWSHARLPRGLRRQCKCACLLASVLTNHHHHHHHHRSGQSSRSSVRAS